MNEYAPPGADRFMDRKSSAAVKLVADMLIPPKLSLTAVARPPALIAAKPEELAAISCTPCGTDVSICS